MIFKVKSKLFSQVPDQDSTGRPICLIIPETS